MLKATHLKGTFIEPRLVAVPTFMNIVGIDDRQAAYRVLRENPNLVVRLGLRRIRVDLTKLDEWIAKGGVINAE